MKAEEQLAQLRAELERLQQEDRALHARIDVAAAGIAALIRHVGDGSDGSSSAPRALTERILDVLADGRARSPSEIVSTLEVVDPTVRANAVRATLSQLVRADRLQRVGRGLYAAPAG